MRSRRWESTAHGDCGSLILLNPYVLADSTTVKLPTGRVDAVLPTRAQGPSSLRPPLSFALICMVSMREPLLLMRRYFMKWRRFANECDIFFSLKGIRARAVGEFTLKVFYKWFLFARRAVTVRSLRSRVDRQNSLFLARRYLRLWRLAPQFRQRRALQLMVLHRIRKEAELHTSKQHYNRWQMVVRSRRVLRQKVATLSACHTTRLLQRYYYAWKRQRRRVLQATQLKLIRYAAQRTLARRTLQKWFFFVSRRIMVSHMERLTLEHFVYRFLVRWRRYAHICKSLRCIGHSSYWRVARRTFHKWKLWLVRIVLALQLEQRNAVFLLQPYFLRWVLLRRMRRLEYDLFVSSALSQCDL
ncbi:hypothetical protein DQ04_03481070 [Trypanosoma grayi]|uniref:hypothetical protein n=1 Tax=Trypanosoma grayi TaxID=71804 RepID=UPI0004F4B8E4|nr:hypothetical protein DQ04_03481070 [Trypanosoma grayi]KEG10637.1 hypothetical protein DQ04_03481070 [Trypanosoma grayi]